MQAEKQTDHSGLWGLLETQRIPLAEAYRQTVQTTFALLRNAYGPTMLGADRDAKLGKAWRETVRAFALTSPSGALLDFGKLTAEAAAFAQHTLERWMKAVLAEVDGIGGAHITPVPGAPGYLQILGTRDDAAVRVMLDRVAKEAPGGGITITFPATYFVNGYQVPAATWRGLFGVKAAA